jgi:hypothetical protein
MAAVSVVVVQAGGDATADQRVEEEPAGTVRSSSASTMSRCARLRRRPSLQTGACRCSSFPCGIAGLGDTPGRRTWFDPWAFTSVATVAHELGHNWGLGHALAAECRSTTSLPIVMPPGGPLDPERCDRWEYGDPFSVMGAGLASSGFSEFERRMIGWSSTDASVFAPTGRYTLTASTVAPATGQRRLLALRSGNRGVFWLEYTPSVAVRSDYDGGTVPSDPGVTIRWGRPLLLEWIGLPAAGGWPWLLDTRPGTSSTVPDFTEMKDAPLRAGETFVDPAGGPASVTVVSTTATSAVVDVTVGPPPVRPAVSPLYVVPGSRRLSIEWALADPGDAPDATIDVSWAPRRPDGTWGSSTTITRAFPELTSISSYVARGLTNGVEHRVRACPRSTLGNGTCVTARSTPVGVAPAPRKPRLERGRQLNVCWDQLNTGGTFGESSVVIERRVGSGAWTRVAVVQAVVSCRSIRYGTATGQVSVRIAVRNEFGRSPWSRIAGPVRPPR